MFVNNTPNIIQLKRKIDKYPVISFDLFDTLIKRDCCRPIEVFKLLEKKINRVFDVQSHFTQARIQAERKAAELSKAGDITLNEIYDHLELPVENENIRIIQQWEQHYEYTLCQWNPYMKPLYEYCCRKEKQIIIITDMYLPKTCIKSILDKLHIHYDALFISSEEQKRKSKGTLFRYVLDTLRMHRSDILHIGDNWRSDYVVPKLLGIDAVHICKDIRKNLILNKKIYKTDSQYADLCDFISNHSVMHSWDAEEKNNIPFQFAQAGYEVEGPVLYGFTKWLMKRFKEDKIEKVFFLARDGQIMQKAYHRLSGQLNIPDEYMYVSRQSLSIPSLWMTTDLSEFELRFGWPWRLTIVSFLKRVGLKPDDFIEFFEKAGLEPDKKYEWQSLLTDKRFLDTYEQYVKKPMMQKSKEQYAYLLKYMKQIDFTGNVAVVDIGWMGHGQHALQQIASSAKIPVNIHGYYLGLRADSPIRNKINAQGYLFDKHWNEDISNIEHTFYCVVETLFAANHGSTSGYGEKEGKICPVLGKWEYMNELLKSEYDWICAAQRGALAFIEDAALYDDYGLIPWESPITFFNWMQLGCYPSVRCAKLFGKLHLMDVVDLQPFVVPCHGKWFFHPKSFIYGMRNSIWRVGYLTVIWGDHVPAFSIYKAIRKVAKSFGLHA